MVTTMTDGQAGSNSLSSLGHTNHRSSSDSDLLLSGNAGGGGGDLPCAQQYVGKSQSCMAISGGGGVGGAAAGLQLPASGETRCQQQQLGYKAIRPDIETRGLFCARSAAYDACGMNRPFQTTHG